MRAQAEDAGLEVHRAADAHRPRCSIRLLTGKRPRRGSDDRRPAPGRSPVLHRQAASRSRSTGCRRSRRKPDITITLGRDDRLADARREVGRTRTTSRASATTTASRRGRSGSRRRCKYLRACRGQFAFEDHETPWSVVCPQPRHQHRQPAELPRRRRRSHGGTVAIQDYVPMWANMKAQFVIDGPRVHLDRIDLDTDGATTVARGDVDIGALAGADATTCKSRVHFPRMRELFFEDEDWRLAGDGDFTGTFHLFKGGGHDLTGHFASDVARRERLPVPGALRVAALDAERCSRCWNAGSRVLRRRRARSPTRSSRSARQDAADGALRRELRRRRSRGASPTSSSCAGCASRAARRGTTCSSGRRAASRSTAATGTSPSTPPPGVAPMTASLDGRARGRRRTTRATSGGRSRRMPLPAHLPIAGELTYRYGPDEVDDRAGPLRDRAHARDVRRRDGVGRASRAAVPRDEPRLAGERSGARRHHHRLRIADRRRCRSAAAASSTA